MTHEISTAARRARWGMIGLFWLNGVAWSSILPRYPEIKASLGLSRTHRVAHVPARHPEGER